MRTTTTSGFGRVLTLATLALAAAMLGCGDDAATGPGGTTGSVSLSLFTPGSSATTSVRGSGLGHYNVVQSDDDETLDIQRVRLVLREIELERVNDECEETASGSDDGCEEFDAGPRLVELPLDGSVQTMIQLSSVPADSYDELEFEIHKPDDTTQQDFIDAHPDFFASGSEIISIRVEGDYTDPNGQTTAFDYTTDLNEDQEITFPSPLVVGESQTDLNVTLTLDVRTWFTADGTATGELIDPASANKGGANENLVRDNIRNSIEAFEDDDEDGIDDDSENS